MLLAACAPAPPATPRPTSSPVRPLGANDTEYTMRHDTVIRTYVLHAPPAIAGRKGNPVVVVLWDNGSADTAMAVGGWREKAGAEGFLVAFGQADRSLWNDGSPAGLAGRVRNGDVGYISAVINDVGRHHDIDPTRLFVAGFGHGGSLAWLAAAEMHHRLAAVATVGGHLYPDQLSAAQSKFAASLYYMVGTNDPQYPLNGGTVIAAAGAREDRAPLQRVIDRWLAGMACGSGTSTGDLAGVRTTIYPGCRAQTEMVLQTLGGHGHTWPGAVLPAGLRANDRIDATSAMWDFFKKHPKAALD